MAHSLITLIPLLIQIEENFSRLYNNVAQIDGQYNPKLKTVALVLSRQEKDHASKYKKLTLTYAAEDLIVNQELYDDIRNLLVAFKKNIQRQNFKDLFDLLTFAIECERKTGQILRNIRDYNLPDNLGALVDELIDAESKHAYTLEQFLPKA